MVLKVYMNLISEPARAVAWLLKVKGVDYEHIDVPFGSEMLKSEEFLKMNPNGLIPVIKDGDFSLFESNAILTYLADKNGWEDVYPKNLEERAKIHQYLHWHHANVRKFTHNIVVPFHNRSMGVATTEQLALIGCSSQLVAKNSSLVDKFLGDKKYIATEEAPSIADYAAYCEYDQLEPLGLLVLDAFPRVAAWVDRMKKIPYHDDVRMPINAFFTSAGLVGVGRTDTAYTDAKP